MCLASLKGGTRVIRFAGTTRCPRQGRKEATTSTPHLPCRWYLGNADVVYPHQAKSSPDLHRRCRDTPESSTPWVDNGNATPGVHHEKLHMVGYDEVAQLGFHAMRVCALFLGLRGKVMLQTCLGRKGVGARRHKLRKGFPRSHAATWEDRWLQLIIVFLRYTSSTKTLRWVNPW